MSIRKLDQIHPRLRRFLSCEGCKLKDYRHNVVLGEGSLPCDLLFVADGPGKNENLLGIPLTGPANHILEEAIRISKILAGVEEDKAISIYKTNVVLCRPCDSKTGISRAPSDDEVIACFRRLETEVVLANPKMVVLLGQTVRRCAGRMFPDALVLPHPMSLVNLGGVQHPAFQQFCRELSVVMKTLAVGHKPRPIRRKDHGNEA